MNAGVSRLTKGNPLKIGDVLPGMNAGASLYAVPSPIEGSGTAWVLLGSWALSPARPTPIHPRHECRGFSALLVTLFGLFAEIERELISMRTKEALAAARAAGKRLGRPPGRLGISKLDGKETDIRRLVALHVSKASIAKITWGRPVDALSLHPLTAPVKRYA